ncbi:MAG: phasin family protein [Sphingomonas sp.]
MASKGPKPETAAKQVTKAVAPRAKRKAPTKPAAEPAAAKTDAPIAPPRETTAPRHQAVAKEPAAPAEAKPTNAVTETVRSAAAEAAATASKGTDTMEDTTTKAQETARNAADAMKTGADRAQGLFIDFNDRAKSAMERGSKMFEEMNDFAKGNVEAVVESTRIAAKGFESLGQEAAEYGRKSFEHATAAMKSFASVKSPTELFKLQSDYVRSAFDSLVAETSKNTESMLKLAGEIAQPLSNRAAVAADKMKVAA